MDDWVTKKIDQYILVNHKLGRGSYGTVYRGYLEQDENQMIAAKQIPIKEICSSTSRIQYIKREIENLQKIDSKYVVKLFGVSRTQTNLYMFLEYCVDGDLKSYLKKKENKILSEPEAIKIFKHIVEGFKELNKYKIIHRDIKPANLLISNGIVKLADFGFSKVVEDEEARLRSFIGSPLYMAPELQEQMPFSSKCDVWSTGIVLYEMLYGKTPWNGSSQLNLFENIKNQPLVFPDEPIRSNKLKSLIKKMLQYYEKDRISWSEIFDDDLINGVRKSMEESFRKRDLVEGFLEKSILENEAYIQKNLVVDYLAHIEEEEDDEYERERKKTNGHSNHAKNNQKKINKQIDEDDNDDLVASEENHTEIMDENRSGAQYQVKQLQFKTKANSSNLITFQDSKSSISPKIKQELKIESQSSFENQKSKGTQKSIDFFFGETSEEKYTFEEKAEQLIKDQIDAEKMRKNILKVNEYILYERNVSFFYNFVIQKLILAYNEKTLKIPQDLYYRVIFIISKCQTINLNKVITMLTSPKSEFSQAIWDQYQLSLDYLKTQKLLIQDCWYAKKFNQELLKKTTQIVNEVLKKESNPQQITFLKLYQGVLNQKMDYDSTFKQAYQKTLSELIQSAKQQAIETDKKDALIIFKYLFVCQNPYSIFKNSEFDFSRFYEQLENIKLQQLRQEILQNPSFKQ
ncbi:dual-specificity kinase domain protein (macronuclear) [Tetrahymena thermophila SB210]|uniref:Dual-specificity kinase domain protein n=1 Tax=Tetrahymena thermophila (strain SB210) TaxID=312017 RepID=I7LZU7_TETTS|nr:dual-specificity kinase domain protein [Tetrahymena thermophila SB210]EAR84947.2 dual-specificity kinase domain protein [Tetrahymena thermophila SB210]|eukprot:XP_001032610.2 dual-specificity kinase domain protein [Tetrahymena thermophila SB210]